MKNTKIRNYDFSPKRKINFQKTKTSFNKSNKKKNFFFLMEKNLFS